MIADTYIGIGIHRHAYEWLRLEMERKGQVADLR
jgi:hypothetical protein